MTSPRTTNGSAGVPTLVVTSIANDAHPIVRQLADGARAAGWRFIMIGDTKSPASFSLDGCEFLGVDAQLAWSGRHGLAYAGLCPTRHYARKNIGYLEAIRAGAPFIVETDDDNFPSEAAAQRSRSDGASGEGTFFGPRSLHRVSRVLQGTGWVNLYRYWSKTDIWPRGLPLDCVQKDVPALTGVAIKAMACPIQQGLADENPDVDAIYRLVRPLPIDFDRGEPVSLGSGAWCPFNSQNTTFFPQAYPLLYLPALCSFRMTDIWRSFVAQRVCHVNGWGVLFHEATVRQLRNDHNLMRDFEDEVSGYTQNAKIREVLEATALQAGEEHTTTNVRACYAALVEKGILPAKELDLLDAWLGDLGVVMDVAPARAAAMIEEKPVRGEVRA